MNEIEAAEIGLAKFKRWRQMAAAAPDRPPPRPQMPDAPERQQPAAAAADLAEMDLGQLAQACAGCRRCVLGKKRTQAVFGVGTTAPGGILLVGEGPGEQEDLKGEPFVGPAGRLLNAMIAAIGIDRSQVYITNAVKCRPPDNRNPGADEIAACFPYLQAQIRLLAPRLIIALGKVAANALLGTSDVKMADMRGRLHEHAGIHLLATYHPSYYLHQPQRKIEGWKDLVQIRKIAAAQEQKR